MQFFEPKFLQIDDGSTKSISILFYQEESIWEN